MNRVKCPCGCEQDVPHKSSSIWRMQEPYWEWICLNTNCERRYTRMQNQSGDTLCSWCGLKRSFVGHFQPGGLYKGQKRITVLGEIVRTPTLRQFIKRTPAHMIRPFQDVT